MLATTVALARTSQTLGFLVVVVVVPGQLASLERIAQPETVGRVATYLPLLVQVLVKTVFLPVVVAARIHAAALLVLVVLAVAEQVQQEVQGPPKQV
jgi:hypothetical protein